MPPKRFIQEVRDVKRLEQIVAALVQCELGFIVEKLRLKKHLSVYHKLKGSKFEEQDTRPHKIMKVLEELGGTFVKLGQLLSVRPDLLPHEYCDAFRKLQDSVPAFSSEEAVKLIELELKKPLKDIFRSFDKKPIAAASIGQVHKAVLKNRKKVAVKVQRPGIKKLIDTDIDILHHLANLIEKYYKPEIFNPVDIVKEFERYTHNELDYSIEAKNIDHFHRNFEKDRITIIPKIYWDYTSGRVLTMEFIPGKKISDIKKGMAKSSKRNIISRVVNSVYKQIFVDGFFHADPHPGNILVMKNKKIGFLDFGIVGYFDDEVKENIAEMFVAMISADIDRIADSMISLGFVEPDINTERLKNDLVAALGRYYDSPLKDINISLLFNELITLARKSRMTMPTDLVLLCKSIVTLEGFAIELDPDFNLVKFSEPFVKKLVRRKMQPSHIMKKFVKTSSSLKDFITRFPKQTTEMIQRITEGDRSIKEIDKDIKVLTTEIDKSSNRVAIGLLITAFIIASALLFTVEYKFYGFPILSAIGFSVAFILIISLLISIAREKKY